ncbi:hypothetical protein [Polaromonas sp. YR568]|uniref:hypothetical protein n=1 Tax=Polaromonas sp. YR568 TaxID=1855301 RepID=UPI00398C0B62
MKRRVFLHSTSAAALTYSLASPAEAKSGYTGRTTLIVRAPAGGPPDIVARKFAEVARSESGYDFIVDNQADVSKPLNYRGTSSVERTIYLITTDQLARSTMEGAADLRGFYHVIAPVAQTPFAVALHPKFNVESLEGLKTLNQPIRLLSSEQDMSLRARTLATVLSSAAPNLRIDVRQIDRRVSSSQMLFDDDIDCALAPVSTFGSLMSSTRTRYPYMPLPTYPIIGSLGQATANDLENFSGNYPASETYFLAVDRTWPRWLAEDFSREFAQWQSKLFNSSFSSSFLPVKNDPERYHKEIAMATGKEKFVTFQKPEGAIILQSAIEEYRNNISSQLKVTLPPLKKEEPQKFKGPDRQRIDVPQDAMKPSDSEKGTGVRGGMNPNLINPVQESPKVTQEEGQKAKVTAPDPRYVKAAPETPANPPAPNGGVEPLTGGPDPRQIAGSTQNGKAPAPPPAPPTATEIKAGAKDPVYIIEYSRYLDKLVARVQNDNDTKPRPSPKPAEPPQTLGTTNLDKSDPKWGAAMQPLQDARDLERKIMQMK